MANRYPIRAVAKITGISLDTLRAWERRYKAVVPERSDRGRQYGPEHIERLLLLGQLVKKGHAIGGIASLTDQELHNLLAQEPGPPNDGPKPTTDILAPVLSAVESFDAARAEDELSRLAAVLSPRDLVYHVAVPLMREVGIRWHDGTFAIAQEHLVSGALRNLLGGMMRLYRPSDAAMKMVLATPAGESHEFGILASAMLASMAGIEPVYLGPDLPAAEIAETAQRVSARVVLLGITLIGETTEEEVSAIASAMPETVELWVGGASGAKLDLASLGRETVLIKDLPALENECRRWRN
ncbi:MAG: MerR family transcriptional regulator [Bryobacteraceae bacterium]|jgi:DNA-binding transcriptional MerR regulator